MMNIYKAIRPLVFQMDAESAHHMTLKLLKTGIVPSCGAVKAKELSQNIFGLRFENPVGISAGFDKNATVLAPALRLGFGAIEAGTVTPKPQNGNPRPRIFRDPESSSIINAMGFPNDGAEVFEKNLNTFLSAANRPDGIVGINIGMNKDQTDPAADYCALIERFVPMADYLTVNISSPNTPGLRDLQHKEALHALLKRLVETRNNAAASLKRTPALLVKLAPDLSEDQQADIAHVLMDCAVDGVILTNTTLDRPETLPQDFREKKGGLSGPLVREKSTSVIRNFYKITNGKLPIIGVGGISTGAHAYEKIKAGASLVQLYTGLVYEGPNVANLINKELLSLLRKDGLTNIIQAIGSDHR